MSTPWSRAAARLREACPVHVVAGRPPKLPPKSLGRPMNVPPGLRREKVREMLASKLSRAEMAQRLGISKVAVGKHIRAIRAADSHRSAEQEKER